MSVNIFDMNPFVTKGYQGPEYFCDRKKETEDIVQLLTNGNNIALISPRRIGKTDLIRHCFSQDEIKGGYYTFLIDIYATSSLKDFVNVFGKTILEDLKPLGRRVWEGFVSALKSLEHKFTFDRNGMPVWTLSVGNMLDPEVTLDEIFAYLSSADKPCLVAIDEFQQIARYPSGEKVEAALRTYIQRCPNATFLFSGSQRHLMTEIFSSPSRPFYQSVVIMGLKVIPEEKYTEFAVRQFSKGGKLLPPRTASEVYARFDGVTSYVQRVMNILYLRTAHSQECTVEMVDGAIDYLLDLYSDNYETLLEQMPQKQKLVFQAIVSEGRAENVTGGEFINKYSLWSSSSVMSAVRSLLEKDFITRDGDVYTPYDKFFTLWLRRYMSNSLNSYGGM